MLKLLFLAALVSAEPLTLAEAAKRALAASESVAVSEQSIRRAEALYRRALGTSFPEISFTHSNTWQEGQGDRPDRQGTFRLTQQNLTGYRELLALRAAGSEERRLGQERRRAEQLVLADVAAAFYGLLQARENVSTTAQLKELAGRRLAELRERVRVGRTREADALAQETQLASLESQLEESARLAAARLDLLAYLTRTADPQPVVDSTGPAPGSLDSYLARLERRPDVAAARAAAQVASAELGVTRAAFLPQVGLTANYYQYRRLARPIAREQSDWDGGFSITVPLWSWGARRAAVAAGRATLGSQELQLRSTLRLAELDVREAHRDVLSAQRQLDIQTRAVELARRDYELQRRDEARGLVTSLEVLESLNRLNSARLSRESALLNSRLAAVNLDIASGNP